MTPLMHSAFFRILSCVVNDTQVDSSLFRIFTDKDWNELYSLSIQQGVVAVVFEQLKGLPKEFAPPQKLSLRWITHAMSIEKQMREREKVANEFANAMKERGIRIAVLKGMAYASYFPNPYHRESGDLDCFLMGKKEDGDKAVVEIGGRYEDGGPKHSHLYFKGLTIENHKFLTNFDNLKLGIKTERLLQELIYDGCRAIEGGALLNPSADFNAMFLVKHAQRHFIREGLCVRHLLDWAFFLKAEAENVDWGRVVPMMQECRILNLARALTSLCIEYLGLNFNVKGLSEHSDMSDRVLADILEGKPNLFEENRLQKMGRFLRRFYRMWRFRALNDEGFMKALWINVSFNKYLNSKLELPQ